jgi:hypothetical protein
VGIAGDNGAVSHHRPARTGAKGDLKDSE